QAPREEPEGPAARIPRGRGARLERHDRRCLEKEHLRPDHDRREVLQGARVALREMRTALAGLLLATLLACDSAVETGAPSQTLPIVKTDGGAEMVLIPEGDFEMGSARGRDEEKPVHKVHVDAFLMD